MSVNRNLTPRQLALATGVSESSIKRWCDAGEIATIRTPGGHRRIPLSGAMQFLRKAEHELKQPELLGLPIATRPGALTTAQAREQLTAGLAAGDEVRCRQVLFELYLNQCPLSVIGDEVISPAFVAIGHGWETGDVEIFQERRAFELTRNLLHELRLAQPSPGPHAPLALGGAGTGDNYALAPILVELVLRECGWRAEFLGTNLPMRTITTAITQQRPQLAWLSVSHIEDEAAFLQEYALLHESTGEQTALVVGGRALHADLRRQMAYSAYCETLQQLAAYSQSLAASASQASAEKMREPL